jgi:hypothetical protein
MQRWAYGVGGLIALVICSVTGYFVAEHLLWVHTFGLPVLSEWGLPAFIAAFVVALLTLGLMVSKLLANPAAKGS